MNELIDLFLSFCRIGGFTFGGGYAMLPMIQKEIVEQRKWATEDEVMDYFAIGQCTPGVIAVNTATFIGYKRKGVLGGIAATAGVIFPSIVIVTLIAAFLNNFAELEMVQNALGAIRTVVGVLILNAVIRMWKKTSVDKICITITVIAFLVSFVFDISPIIVVVIGGGIGLFLKGGKKA